MKESMWKKKDSGTRIRISPKFFGIWKRDQIWCRAKVSTSSGLMEKRKRERERSLKRT